MALVSNIRAVHPLKGDTMTRIAKQPNPSLHSIDENDLDWKDEPSKQAKKKIKEIEEHLYKSGQKAACQ